MAVALVLGAGCAASGNETAEDASAPPEALLRGVAAVLGPAAEAPLALGAVVRATEGEAVLLACVAASEAGPFRVRIPGDPPVAARVLGRRGDLVLLAIPRSGHDLRPLEVTSEPPAPLAPAIFVPARSPRAAAPRPATIAAEPPASARPGGASWLVEAPRLDDDDDRTPEARAGAARGSLVFDARNHLVGLVGDPDGVQPRLFLALSALAAQADALVLPPGADVVRPDDVFLAYGVKARVEGDLPVLAGPGESGPMLAIELRLAGEVAGRIEVGPARPSVESLIVARGERPLSVRLVALDRSLAQGETRVELSREATFPAVEPSLDVALELDPRQLARYAGTARSQLARLHLDIAALDPDRAGGSRRTPALAATLPLGRPREGVLDLAGGQASEFLAVADPVGEPVVAFLYRRTLGGGAALQAFAPGWEGDLLAVAAGPRGPRVAVATGRLPRGRTFLRVRQTSGQEPVPYEVLVASRSDGSAVVDPLFRLVSREAAKEGGAFMDSDAFVEDVAEALEKTGLTHEALCRSLLDELGGRIAVARRLAFALLERHFIPSRELLGAAFAAGGAAGQDAGLVLAELDPREPSVRPVLRRACADDDPYVRARAVRAAARSGDPAFAEEVAGLVAADAAPIVQRAASAARLSALLLRDPGR